MSLHIQSPNEFVIPSKLVLSMSPGPSGLVLAMLSVVVDLPNTYEVSIWANLSGLRMLGKFHITHSGSRSFQPVSILWNYSAESLCIVFQERVVFLKLHWYRSKGDELIAANVALELLVCSRDKIRVRLRNVTSLEISCSHHAVVCDMGRRILLGSESSVMFLDWDGNISGQSYDYGKLDTTWIYSLPLALSITSISYPCPPTEVFDLSQNSIRICSWSDRFRMALLMQQDGKISFVITSKLGIRFSPWLRVHDEEPLSTTANTNSVISAQFVDSAEICERNSALLISVIDIQHQGTYLALHVIKRSTSSALNKSQSLDGMDSSDSARADPEQAIEINLVSKSEMTRCDMATSCQIECLQIHSNLFVISIIGSIISCRCLCDWSAPIFTINSNPMYRTSLIFDKIDVLWNKCTPPCLSVNGPSVVELSCCVMLGGMLVSTLTSKLNITEDVTALMKQTTLDIDNIMSTVLLDFPFVSSCFNPLQYLSRHLFCSTDTVVRIAYDSATFFESFDPHNSNELDNELLVPECRSNRFTRYTGSSFEKFSSEFLQIKHLPQLQVKSGVASILSLNLPTKLQVDLRLFYCKQVKNKSTRLMERSVNGGLLVCDSQSCQRSFRACSPIDNGDGNTAYLAAAVGGFIDVGHYPQTSKISSQGIETHDATTLWIYNCFTKRWRGTFLDPENLNSSDSTKGCALELVEEFTSPRAKSSSLHELPTGINQQQFWNPQTRKLSPRNCCLANMGQLKAILGVTWYATHTLIIVGLRRSRYTLECFSKEVGKSSMSAGRPYPLVHRIHCLPPGFCPKVMDACVHQSFNSGRNSNGQHEICTVLLGDNVNFFAFQITAVFDKIEGTSSQDNHEGKLIRDYHVFRLWEISLENSYHQYFRFCKNSLSSEKMSITTPVRRITQVIVSRARSNTIDLLPDESDKVGIDEKDIEPWDSLYFPSETKFRKGVELAFTVLDGAGLVWVCSAENNAIELLSTRPCRDLVVLPFQSVAHTDLPIGACISKDECCSLDAIVLIFCNDKECKVVSEPNLNESNLRIWLPSLSNNSDSIPFEQISSCIPYVYIPLQSSSLVSVCLDRFSGLLVSVEGKCTEIRLGGHSMISVNDSSSETVTLHSNELVANHRGAASFFLGYNIATSEISLSHLLLESMLAVVNSTLYQPISRRDVNRKSSTTNSRPHRLRAARAYIDLAIGCLKSARKNIRHANYLSKRLESILKELIQEVAGRKDRSARRIAAQRKYKLLVQIICYVDPLILMNVISILSRKLEPEISGLIFPLPVQISNDILTCELDENELRRLFEEPHEPGGVSALELFEVALINDRYDIASRVLIGACESLGATESIRTIHSSLILGFELFRESIDGNILSQATQIVDFCFRLEVMTGQASGMRGDLNVTDIALDDQVELLRHNNSGGPQPEQSTGAWLLSLIFGTASEEVSSAPVVVDVFSSRTSIKYSAFDRTSLSISHADSRLLRGRTSCLIAEIGSELLAQQRFLTVAVYMIHLCSSKTTRANLEEFCEWRNSSPSVRDEAIQECSGGIDLSTNKDQELYFGRNQACPNSVLSICNLLQISRCMSKADKMLKLQQVLHVSGVMATLCNEHAFVDWSMANNAKQAFRTHSIELGSMLPPNFVTNSGSKYCHSMIPLVCAPAIDSCILSKMTGYGCLRALIFTSFLSGNLLIAAVIASALLDRLDIAVALISIQRLHRNLSAKPGEEEFKHVSAKELKALLRDRFQFICQFCVDSVRASALPNTVTSGLTLEDDICGNRPSVNLRLFVEEEYRLLSNLALRCAFQASETLVTIVERMTTYLASI